MRNNTAYAGITPGSELPYNGPYKIRVEYVSAEKRYVMPDATTIVTEADVLSIPNRELVKRVWIGSGMITIAAYAFKEKMNTGSICNLEEVYIPNTVTTMQTEAMHNITSAHAGYGTSLITPPIIDTGSNIDFTDTPATSTYTFRYWAFCNAATFTVPPGDNLFGHAQWEGWAMFNGRFILDGTKTIIGSSCFQNAGENNGGTFEVEFTQTALPTTVHGDWVGTVSGSSTCKVYAPVTSHTLLEWKNRIATGEAANKITHINDTPLASIT